MERPRTTGSTSTPDGRRRRPTSKASGAAAPRHWSAAPNYEGFHSAWPDITADPATDPRTRALGQWLATVDKAVLSTTLTDAPWENSRIFRDLRTAVDTLRTEPGGDILVINSASVIQGLLREDEVDDLQLMVVPVLLGGGLRLLPDGVGSAWSLASSTTMAHGAIALHYRRER